MAQKTMYDTIVGDRIATLTADFAAGTDTTISVDDLSWLPPGPNTATVRLVDKSKLVTVTYTGKTDTQLTGVTVLEADSTESLSALYPAGSALSDPLTHDDIETIQDNIRDHEERIEALESSEPPEVTWGNIKGDIRDQFDLESVLSTKANVSPESPDLTFGYDVGGVFISVDDTKRK